MKTENAVLLFGDRSAPRVLASWPALAVSGPGDIDSVIQTSRRVAVIGDDADVAAVLTRLIRTDRLDVEVAPVRGWRSARRAARGTAQRRPLIRDDTGTALARGALWLPPENAASIRGEAVVDDVVLFDGDVTGVRIEPTAELPGLRVRLLDGRPRRWVSGRAAQLGTTGARVVRDGIAGQREVKRSTFYRHTTGWLRVG